MLRIIKLSITKNMTHLKLSLWNFPVFLWRGPKSYHPRLSFSAFKHKYVQRTASAMPKISLQLVTMLLTWCLLQIRYNGSTFMVWDVGGQDKLRPLWRSYTRCTDGIIFVVDSSREESLEEAKLELQNICKASPNGVAPGRVTDSLSFFSNVLKSSEATTDGFW